jgi:hypothetical protein
MSDLKNCNGALLVIDLIDDSVVVDTYAPTCSSCQLETPLWPRVQCQCPKRVADAHVGFMRKLP